MGVGLALYLVDHDTFVVRGLPLLNRVLDAGDVGPLRAFLKQVPFDEPDPDVIEALAARVARLREMNAPAVLVESQEQRLRAALRPSPEVLDSAGLDRLDGYFRRWCPEPRTRDLDKSWDLIHWLCDPDRRTRAVGDWRGPPPLSEPSPFDYAIHGAGPYPTDVRGVPAVRTDGSPDASYYNPPDVVRWVARAIESLDTGSFPAVAAAWESLPDEHAPDAAGAGADYALENFDRFRSAYGEAARRGFGVSCEFY